MKKKKLKEFVILSLIFILIIACIILLILIIRDKYYLSQESIIYISESPNPDYFQLSDSVSSYYSIYKDGTVYNTEYRYTSDIEYTSFKKSHFVKKLNKSELESLTLELSNLSNSSYVSTKYPSLKDWNIHDTYYCFSINDSTYYSKNYSVYTNILAKYINQHDYESNQISSYIYNYIKKEYPATNPNFELTDTDKQNILINVKKHYPNSKLSDYEILDLININSVGIMVEQIEQLH